MRMLWKARRAADDPNGRDRREMTPAVAYVAFAGDRSGSWGNYASTKITTVHEDEWGSW